MLFAAKQGRLTFSKYYQNDGEGISPGRQGFNPFLKDEETGQEVSDLAGQRESRWGSVQTGWWASGAPTSLEKPQRLGLRASLGGLCRHEDPSVSWKSEYSVVEPPSPLLHPMRPGGWADTGCCRGIQHRRMAGGRAKRTAVRRPRRATSLEQKSSINKGPGKEWIVFERIKNIHDWHVIDVRTFGEKLATRT